VYARVGNQRSYGVVTARVRTDAVRSLRHQRRDLHQSTYSVPLERSGLILLSWTARRKCTRAVRGLARESYMSCVLSFPLLVVYRFESS
jgi:hypothetical protein